MVKADEIELYNELWARCPIDAPYKDRERVRDVIASLDINEKRALYLLDKWSDRGWYEWGVVIDGGWFTPEAPSQHPGDGG